MPEVITAAASARSGSAQPMMLYPELPVLWNMMRTIGKVAPKVAPDRIAIAAAEVPGER